MVSIPKVNGHRLPPAAFGRVKYILPLFRFETIENQINNCCSTSDFHITVLT